MPAKLDNGLTMKQEEFAIEVGKGSTLIEAYEKAYGNGKPRAKHWYNEASKMHDHPLVSRRINEIVQERKERSLLNDVPKLRQYIYDRLMIESANDKNPAASRVRSLELLGKIDTVGMFKEQANPEPKDKRSVDEIKKELEARLKSLRIIDAE